MGKEKNTDMWVHDLLTSANIKHEADGSDIKEINEALKTASKRNTGKVGKPEFICVVKDFLIVIEDKASISKHIKLDENDVISLEVKDVTDYAVNGAYFYGKHLFDNTSYKKIIAFGVSGNSKKHKITPLFIDGTEYCRILPDVESFISFNEMNIDEYYIKEVLKENTNEEKELSEILKDAAILHEDLRNYGNLKDIDKPLIVSGILLALREMEYKNFSVDNLTGDDTKTDGTKIYEAIKTNLDRSNVKPETKKDKLLHQFSIIKDTAILNEKNGILGMTPLKYFTIFLKDKLYDSIRFNNSSEDYLGRFYGEFMSYSGGDGQTLGIVLTPKHITDLFCKLADLKDDDIVLDPCCGTGGFLVSALNHMKESAEDTSSNEELKKAFYGVEKKSLPYLLCTTNMLLHDINEPNIIRGNSLEKNVRDYEEDDKFDVILMNPPYGGTEKKSVQQNFPTELRNSETADLFMIEILYRLKQNGRVGIVLPDGFLFGTDNTKVAIKKKLLEECNLHTIIRLPGSIFAPYTSIATNLLFFDKTGPTKEIWFYRMDLPDGFKAFSKTKPVTLKHFEEIISWWNNRVEIKDEKKDESMSETWKSKRYSIEKLESINYNLDQCGYPIEEEKILTPMETMDNFIKKREQLEKQLDEKLNKIISNRYDNELPIVITTRYNKEQLIEQLSTENDTEIAEEIVKVLNEMCYGIEITEERKTKEKVSISDQTIC